MLENIGIGLLIAIAVGAAVIAIFIIGAFVSWMNSGSH